MNSVYEGGKFFGFMIRMHSMAEISNVTLSSKVLQHFLHSLTDFLLLKQAKYKVNKSEVYRLQNAANATKCRLLFAHFMAFS